VTLIATHAATDHPVDYGVIEARIAWLVEHGLDPADIYRFEVHVIDVPLIRVFEYLRRDGRTYCPFDHVHGSRCELAKRDPYDVLIRVDPPAQLGIDIPTTPKDHA
jgi:hypothetical protein